jgi:ParB family chromosome partitioning protein
MDNTDKKENVTGKKEEVTEKKAKVGKVALTELKPHPRQQEVFADLPEEQLEELAADMRLNGQLVPIEVLPGGTIICGHQRVRAARKLGWDTVRAIIRADLAAQGKAAVFDRLVGDNLNRRQLDPLGQARCYQKLKENASKLSRKARSAYAGVDLRDVLAKRFNMSGRTLDRWLRVLSTPVEVQRAVSAGKLSLASAGRVAGADQAIAEMIATEIRLGKDPEEAVADYLLKKAQKQVNDLNAVMTFIRHLRSDVPDLEGRVNQLNLRGPLNPDQIDLLRRAGQVAQLLAIKCAPKEVARPLDVPAEIGEPYLAQAV